MSIPQKIIVAAAVTLIASPALGGGGSGVRAHGVAANRSHAQPSGGHGHMARVPVTNDARDARSQAHKFYGGPRLEQRPDPNYLNPYRPMYSLDAVNPGQTHPYFRTPREGFGYPPAHPAPVYLGNGVYVIPR